MARRGADPVFWTLGDGAPPAGAFVALAPGEAVPLLPVEVPARLRGAAWERVARRQLSDTLGLPPGAVDMRPAMKRDGVTPRALVTGSETRDGWCAEVAGTGCSAILPDYLALPAAEGLWTLAAEGSRIMARLGPWDGFSAETGLARALLDRALAGTAPEAVLTRGALPDDLLALFRERQVPVAADAAGLPSGLAPPSRLTHSELALDLLRDPAALRAELGRALARWRVPALLALLALAGWWGALRVETEGLREAARAHRQAAETTARRVFIPSGPILDLRAQIGREVSDRQAAAGAASGALPPLELFRAAAPVLDRSDATVRRVAFRAASGLLVDLVTGDFASVDRVAAALREAGLRVEVVQSAAGEEAGVSATLALDGA